MQNVIIIQPQPRAWLEGSILRPYVSHYAEQLQRRRYAPNTQRAYLRCVAHFAHWLSQEGYDLEAIGQGAVMRFLSEHLPSCACPDPVRRFHHELQAALGHLLEVLEACGVALQYPARNSAIEGELTRFDTHMRDVWGLAESTRRRRCRVVGEFLVEHFGERPISMTTVKTTSIRRFILGEQGRGPAAVAAIGVTIACYLRFRSMSGDRTNELKAAIPRVARWRLASLPEVLTDTEIDELLSSFDQSFPSRPRAYAMVRCLIDLGLRSGEVVKLQLDGIDWANGTINLVGTKSRRTDALPRQQALVHSRRNSLRCQAVARQQHDPCPPNHLLRRVSVPNQPLQSFAISRTDPNLLDFPHRRRFAGSRRFVNCLSATEH